MSTSQAILDFHRGTGTDATGRTIKDVWNFDFDKLEGVHDYIQWLFPTATASAYNKDAPLVDSECVRAFADDVELRHSLVLSFRQMLHFYGLEIDGCCAVRKAANYAERRANWQDAPQGYLNHNLLRITRIIESLRLLGMPKYAKALCLCVEEIQKEQPEQIPMKTVLFWRKAAGLA